MKTRPTALAFCVALFAANHALADVSPFDGGAPLATELKMKLNGQPVTVVRITADYHQMNLPPGSAQPIGLREFNYILKGTTDGNAARCERWVKRVNADEAAWTKSSPTFPYLEINFAQGAKPVMLSTSIRAYRQTDVQCWEAMDFGEPIF